MSNKNQNKNEQNQNNQQKTKQRAICDFGSGRGCFHRKLLARRGPKAPGAHDTIEESAAYL